ncbi:protein GRINL1A isoform X2 [Onychomys torridus]|uniref:protein GRINL1A isoform X2 n=1 Tax=Onychomys torridus TaxID=38674 RepID=UPI00167F95A8|nr:protein GRINL1A isoform X2 [Onychomys torridus]
MFSLPRGFEPPAPEDLGQRSSVELRERLRRQERLLRNDLFITMLQKVTMADQSEPSEENPNADVVPGLQSETPKRPHYMEVVEMRAKTPVLLPPMFKSNVLPTQQSDSPGHCQSNWSPASSEEQRRWAGQHLDDITAARLLLLHHLPAQLLAIEESLALQKEQKQNYEEMQAKLTARKLA